MDELDDRSIELTWVAIDEGLPNHHKVHRLNAALGIDTADAYVVRLLCWALNHARRGVIPPADVPALEGLLGWRGGRGVLLNALRQTGFLDAVGDDGTLLIHNWSERQLPKLQRTVRDISRKRGQRSTGRWKDPELLDGRAHGAAAAGHNPNPNLTTEQTGGLAATGLQAPGRVLDLFQTRALEAEAARLQSKQSEPPPPPPPPAVDRVAAMQEAYNRHRGKLPEWRVTPPKRAELVKKALKFQPELGWWVQVFQAAACDPWATGEKPSRGHEHWKADPDYLLKPEKAARFVERAAAATPAGTPAKKFTGYQDEPWEGNDATR